MSVEVRDERAPSGGRDDASRGADRRRARARAELRLVRERTRGPLSEAHLESLAISLGAGATLVEAFGNHYVLNLRHPLVRAACDQREADPTLVSMVASAVYTYLNYVLAEIEDSHEEVFHRHHCQHILTSLGR